MPEREYRALVVRAGAEAAGALLHLVRAGAESSLCGITRAGLGPAGENVELVCPDCIEWLRSNRVSGWFKNVGRE